MEDQFKMETMQVHSITIGEEDATPKTCKHKSLKRHPPVWHRPAEAMPKFLLLLGISLELNPTRPLVAQIPVVLNLTCSLWHR